MKITTNSKDKRYTCLETIYSYQYNINMNFSFVFNKDKNGRKYSFLLSSIINKNALDSRKYRFEISYKFLSESSTSKMLLNSSFYDKSELKLGIEFTDKEISNSYLRTGETNLELEIKCISNDGESISRSINLDSYKILSIDTIDTPEVKIYGYSSSKNFVNIEDTIEISYSEDSSIGELIKNESYVCLKLITSSNEIFNEYKILISKKSGVAKFTVNFDRNKWNIYDSCSLYLYAQRTNNSGMSYSELYIGNMYIFPRLETKIELLSNVFDAIKYNLTDSLHHGECILIDDFNYYCIRIGNTTSGKLTGIKVILYEKIKNGSFMKYGEYSSQNKLIYLNKLVKSLNLTGSTTYRLKIIPYLYSENYHYQEITTNEFKLRKEIFPEITGQDTDYEENQPCYEYSSNLKDRMFNNLINPEYRSTVNTNTKLKFVTNKNVKYSDMMKSHKYELIIMNSKDNSIVSSVYQLNESEDYEEFSVEDKIDIISIIEKYYASPTSIKSDIYNLSLMLKFSGTTYDNYTFERSFFIGSLFCLTPMRVVGLSSNYVLASSSSDNYLRIIIADPFHTQHQLGIVSKYGIELYDKNNSRIFMTYLNNSGSPNIYQTSDSSIISRINPNDYYILSVYPIYTINNHNYYDNNLKSSIQIWYDNANSKSPVVVYPKTPSDFEINNNKIWYSFNGDILFIAVTLPDLLDGTSKSANEGDSVYDDIRFSINDEIDSSNSIYYSKNKSVFIGESIGYKKKIIIAINKNLIKTKPSDNQYKFRIQVHQNYGDKNEWGGISVLTIQKYFQDSEETRQNEYNSGFVTVDRINDCMSLIKGTILSLSSSINNYQTTVNNKSISLLDEPINSIIDKNVFNLISAYSISLNVLINFLSGTSKPLISCNNASGPHPGDSEIIYKENSSDPVKHNYFEDMYKIYQETEFTYTAMDGKEYSVLYGKGDK